MQFDVDEIPIAERTTWMIYWKNWSAHLVPLMSSATINVHQPSYSRYDQPLSTIINWVKLSDVRVCPPTCGWRVATGSQHDTWDRLEGDWLGNHGADHRGTGDVWSQFHALSSMMSSSNWQGSITANDKSSCLSWYSCYSVLVNQLDVTESSGVIPVVVEQ